MLDTTGIRTKALFLAGFTIAYNLIEGIVSIYFGISSEAISLFGFGGDSLIEVSSAGIVLWKLLGNQEKPAYKERKATLWIGILFLVLASITAIMSLYQLAHIAEPDTTFPGFIISILSLSFMFFLWKAKIHVARKLDSSTLMKDADCSLACIKLSVVLLVGSSLFLMFPQLWWVDATAALVLAWLIGKEGIETIRATRSKDFKGGCGCVGK